MTPTVPANAVGNWCAAAGGLNSPPLASGAGSDTRPGAFRGVLGASVERWIRLPTSFKIQWLARTLHLL